MSTLNDKIQSYSPEVNIEFDTTYSTSPTNTGSVTLSAWTTSSPIPSLITGDSPIGGSQNCWQANANGDASSRFRNTTTAFMSSLTDRDFFSGIWFKPTVFQTGTSTTLNSILSVNPSTLNAFGFNISISSSGATTPNKLFMQGPNGIAARDIGGPTIELNRWYYLGVRRTTTNISVYLDGSLIFSFDNSSTVNTSPNFTIGSTSCDVGVFRFSNVHTGTTENFTSTAIAEIWTAGTATGTDINFTTTPATATNAHFPEPIVSTEVGVSFGTEPGTANAEISYLSVSGEVNFVDSFRIATAILTTPTLAFTFNDNTEVVTSITASAEFIEPFNFGGQTNNSTSAQLMEASATIGEHNAIAATGISYAAELVGSASALMVEPLRFGPDDFTHTAAPMIASNGVMTGTAVVPTTYFKLVKDLNPLYYVRDWTGSNAVLLNEGSADLGTVDKGIVGSTSWAVTQQSSGAPMSGVGDGTSPQILQPYSTDANRWRLTEEAKFANILADLYVTKNFTHEWWYKPSITTTETNSSRWYYDDNFLTIDLKQSLTLITLIVTIDTINTTGGDQTYTFSIPAENYSMLNNTWHHVVVQFEPSSTSDMKVSIYINNILVGSQTKPFLSSRENVFLQLTSGANSMDWYVYGGILAGQNTPTLWDELAIYPAAIGTSAIQSHYNFIDTLSPNKTINASPLEADAIFPEPNVIREENRNFPATPITGSALFVDPTVLTEKYLTFATTPGTVSAQFVEPLFYGTPDYRKDAELLTAFIEMTNNNFALDDTYYSYVNTNIAPFKYVTFDGQNEYQDFGSDNDYSVASTIVGGTITLPSFGINNKSAKTAGQNYATDGVILKESEWNDTWGTGQNTYHSSFWMQRAGDDVSNTGIRVLWNLNGFKDNQHVILYQHNNKLHMQFNNGSGTFIEQTTVSDVNVFDYERHHIIINFDHTNVNNNNVLLYVDSVLVMTVSLGAYTGTTTNYATSQPANDEAYNKPRLGIGCLITPFANTALSAQPQNTKIYADEIHWALTGLNQTQVTALYSAMPTKDNVEWYADFFLGQNATLVNPIFGAGCTITATPLTASAEAFTPTLFTEFSNVLVVDPLQASALAVEPGFFGDDVRHVNFAADFMFASAFLVGSDIIQTIGANAMLATIRMVNSEPYYDPYSALIIQQSRVPLGTTTTAGGWALSGWGVGDIDS